jgi:hypothetical protein
MAPAKVLVPWINQIPAPPARVRKVLKGATQKVGDIHLIITLNGEGLDTEKPNDKRAVSHSIETTSLPVLSLSSASRWFVMGVMTGCVAFSSGIFGWMYDDIELSLTAWACINLAHCVDALSQDQ